MGLYLLLCAPKAKYRFCPKTFIFTIVFSGCIYRSFHFPPPWTFEIKHTFMKQAVCVFFAPFDILVIESVIYRPHRKLIVCQLNSIFTVKLKSPHDLYKCIH